MSLSKRSVCVFTRSTHPIGFQAFLAHRRAIAAPLVGKSWISDVTDALEGVFELLVMLCVRAHLFDVSV